MYKIEKFYFLYHLFISVNPLQCSKISKRRSGATDLCQNVAFSNRSSGVDAVSCWSVLVVSGRPYLGKHASYLLIHTVRSRKSYFRYLLSQTETKLLQKMTKSGNRISQYWILLTIKTDNRTETTNVITPYVNENANELVCRFLWVNTMSLISYDLQGANIIHIMHFHGNCRQLCGVERE